MIVSLENREEPNGIENAGEEYSVEGTSFESDGTESMSIGKPNENLSKDAKFL